MSLMLSFALRCASPHTLDVLSFRILILVASLIVSGCKTTPPPQAPLLKRAMATHAFTLANDDDNVIGQLQVTQAHAEDTLSDIARRFNIGYEEIVRANPRVDPWLPREGTQIVLPTQFVLPDAPRAGLVINLPSLRAFYFPPRKPGEPQTVITHPIGIGMVGWSTPVGETKIVSKRTDPTWTPPASVRREHAEEGDPLPAKVKPGPDNPLGRFAMNLGWPSYLIHGTNQPYGIGVRASHGCIRMYPEDIEELYDDIPVGTKVTVVNQPQVYGMQGGVQYLQTYPVFEDYDEKKPKKKSAKPASAQSNKPVQLAKLDTKANAATMTDNPLVGELMKSPRGIAIPISLPAMNLDKLIADAPRVENRLPENATWDGIE